MILTDRFKTPKQLFLHFFIDNPAHPLAEAFHHVLNLNETEPLDAAAAIAEFLYALRSKRIKVPAGSKLAVYMRRKEAEWRKEALNPVPVSLGPAENKPEWPPRACGEDASILGGQPITEDTVDEPEEQPYYKTHPLVHRKKITR